MSKFPHGGDALGAQPGHLLLAPVLRPEMVLSRQQALLDLQAIQRIPGLNGYWPADPAYLFEDSAGTIPANTGGTGVVGLSIDISQGGALGPELAANGGFDSDTVWIKLLTGVSISDGNLVFTNSPDGAVAYQESPGVSLEGELYQVEVDITACSGQIQIVLGNGIATGSSVFYATVGRSTIILRDGTSPEYIQIIARGPSTNATIASISVKRILGNYAYQQTTNKKPILKRTPTSNVYWLNSDADDGLTATLGNLGSACTVARAGAEGVTFTEGVTISSTYNIAPAFGFNGDVAIFNRALTTTEKALLTRYMSRGVPLVVNLLANGTFDSADGWTDSSTGSGTATIAGGVASITGDGWSNLGRLYKNPSLTASTPGSAILFGLSVVSGSCEIWTEISSIGGSTIIISGAISNNTYTRVFQNVNGVTSGKPIFYVYGTGTRTIDNIIVKELL